MPRPIVIYSLPKVYGVKSCVYKMLFNDRYIIVKAKDHQLSVQVMQKALNQFFRNSESQHNPENLYYHFFSYIKKHKEGKFVVEILVESDNPYQLLVSEQTELDKAKGDNRCLNNNVDAYVPQFNEITGTYGWISKNAYLNFKKWLKSHK